MFSYVINNPNNFVIQNDYFIIPFGHRCATALACKYANIRKFSLPFDWGIPFFPKTIKQILKNNFEGFTDFVFEKNITRNKKYNFKSMHFDSNIVELLKRRIARFNDIITQSKKIYFIYINEDYLYDNSYRADKFNNEIFNQMLELEKFIKKKYVNIDYNILYFNFKHHTIPINSNIINIVLQTTNLYDTDKGAPFDELRNYCGKILAELFNTNLTLGFDKKVFNN
jgi:hypothetical protein